MNKEEARAVLAERVVQYRSRPYDQLLRLLDDQDELVCDGPSGTKYYVEGLGIWDDPPKPDLRVLGTINDDGLWSSVSSLCEDFIVRPDGSFVGE
jgi:hypothetical protein